MAETKGCFKVYDLGIGGAHTVQPYCIGTAPAATTPAAAPAKKAPATDSSPQKELKCVLAWSGDGGLVGHKSQIQFCFYKGKLLNR